MSRLIPLTTAAREVSDLLSDPKKVARLYEQLAELERSPDTGKQKAESSKAESLKKELCAAEFCRMESASLRLSKFVHLGATTKDDEIREVCKRMNRSDPRRADWHLPETLCRTGKEIVMKLEGRLTIHLAGGILENAGMCIHPHFNCPYLPGSGVKGVARHAAWAKWDESKHIDDALKVAWTFGYPTGDKEGLDRFLAAERPEWFGQTGMYKSFAGLVSFLPAFPSAEGFKAVVDVTTCHHPKYYTGKKKRATDDEAPNPQFFPAIESGSSFRFILRPLRNHGGGELPSSADVLEWAREFLIEGMSLFGAGAKTAAGYGWFTYDPEEEKRWQAQLADKRKRQDIADKSTSLQKDTAGLTEPTPTQFSEMKKRFDELISEANAMRMELPGKQSLEDALNRMKKRLSQRSPLDQLRESWAAQNAKAVVNGEIKRFDKLKPDRKKLVVELLREPDGIGHEIWNEIRSGQKGAIANGVLAIRTYCKRELKLGKMP